MVPYFWVPNIRNLSACPKWENRMPEALVSIGMAIELFLFGKKRVYTSVSLGNDYFTYFWFLEFAFLISSILSASPKWGKRMEDTGLGFCSRDRGQRCFSLALDLW
jgi:hypothetical protein